MSTDLFIKTCAKDRGWLEFCLRSIDRHATGFRRLVVVTDPDGPAPIQTTTHAIWHTGPAVPPGKLHGMPMGYWWQMAAKMSWDTFTDADAVVIVDSDCVFTGPISPSLWIRDLRPIWFARPWLLSGDGICWKPSVDYFLGHESPASHMCRNGFLLTRELTEAVRAFLWRRFGQTPWEFVVDPRHVKPEEYESIGGYLATVDRMGYTILRPEDVPDWPLAQFWSWGVLDDGVRRSMELAMGPVRG